MAYSPIPNITTDLSPNSFGDAGGKGLSQQVITDLDILQPFELPMLFYRHTKRMSFKNRLTMAGFRMPTKNTQYGSFELPWYESLITVNAVITPAGGAGNPLVFNLPSNEHYDAGASLNGTGLKASFPLETEVFAVVGGDFEGTQVYIKTKNVTTAPNNHRLTVYCKDPTIDLDDVLEAGVKLRLQDSMHGEGTGLPGGRVPRIIQYLNTDQTIKTSGIETGHAATVATRVSDTDGMTYYKLAVKDMMYDLHDTKVSNALLFGQQNTNTDIAQFSQPLGHDVTPSSTKGFLPSLLDDSNVDTYPSGAYSITDFYEMTTSLAAQWGVTHEFMTMDGMAITQKTEQFLTDFYAQNLTMFLAQDWMMDERIDYDKWGFTSSDALIAKLGFRGLVVNNFSFLFTTLHEFTKPVGAGASGSSYPNYRIVAPMNTRLATEVEGKQKMPLFGYRYRQYGNLDREMIYDTLAGVGSVMRGAVNEWDARQDALLSHVGFHMISANQFAIQIPV